jgi:APA family basic amino acid/polyamine antiporter
MMRHRGEAGDRPLSFRRALTSVDFTLLVIGAVIGADIYIVSGYGAALLGPAQLVARAAAGALAALIALAFVQCAAICPQVGGSYAYAHAAFGPLAGFLTGWALYLGEFIALPVFPLTFAAYVQAIIPGLSRSERVLIELALIVAVTGSNLRGVRTGGSTNDVLTLAKLLPLMLLIVAGLIFAATHTSLAAGNLHPFAPLGWRGFGSAVILIFWAYAGFELAVLPAGEVEAPNRTLPFGLLVGMGIATLFYLLTSLAVVVVLPWQTAANSTRPLADAFSALLASLGMSKSIGEWIMVVGAAISIAGAYEVFTLGLARLSYAVAADGLFPPAFARLQRRTGIPYVGLLFQAAAGFIMALFLNVQNLIAIAMFFLGLCYLATALAALRLAARNPNQRLHVPGLRAVFLLAAASGLYLSSQVPYRLLLAGALAMIAGFAAYIARRAAWQLSAALAPGEALGEQAVERWLRHREAWLLHFLRRPPRRADSTAAK